MEAFSEAATDRASIRASTERRVELEAAGIDLLFVDSLREALYEFESHDLLIRTGRASVSRHGDAWRLRGTFTGERFDASRHGIKVLIKAVTYHGLAVGETPDGWSATVIVDL